MKLSFQSLLHIPSLLCLDVPLVAAGWATLLAIEGGRGIDRTAIAGLTIAVWAIYLIDRIWDTRGKSTGYPQTPRHRFAAANRPTLAGMAIALCIAGAFSILPHFDHSKLWHIVVLGTVVVIYFLVFRFLQRRTHSANWLQKVPGKELMIGICFTGGIFIASDVPFRSVAAILLSAGMAILFTLNCLLIAEAEIPIDREFDPASFFIRNGVESLPYFSLLAIPFGAGVAASFLGGFLLTSLSLTLATFFTYLLTVARFRPTPSLIQPLADGLLLCPWLVLAVSHFAGQGR